MESLDLIRVWDSFSPIACSFVLLSKITTRQLGELFFGRFVPGFVQWTGFRLHPQFNSKNIKSFLDCDLGHVFIEGTLSLQTKLGKSISPNLFEKAISVFFFI